MKAKSWIILGVTQGLFILSFQNCGGNFDAASASGVSELSVSAPSTGVMPMTAAASAAARTTSVAAARSSGLSAPANDAFGASFPVTRFYLPTVSEHTYRAPGQTVAGAVNEGTAFSLYGYSSPVRNPLFLCQASATHSFISMDSRCEGQQVAGLLGHANKDPIFENDRPLMRCYHRGLGHHLITHSTAECLNNGFEVEGILGWVP